MCRKNKDARMFVSVFGRAASGMCSCGINMCGQIPSQLGGVHTSCCVHCTSHMYVRTCAFIWPSVFAHPQAFESAHAHTLRVMNIKYTLTRVCYARTPTDRPRPPQSVSHSPTRRTRIAYDYTSICVSHTRLDCAAWICQPCVANRETGESSTSHR